MNELSTSACERHDRASLNQHELVRNFEVRIS